VRRAGTTDLTDEDVRTRLEAALLRLLRAHDRTRLARGLRDQEPLAGG
ncbi:MAG: hypothetical protein QOG46_1061, partial [Pseudonocardiales bacterium]|nr:hypothetical protein [Pseudonocardiales bacterium]